ncbi:MAG: TonB-dependent receptor [Candidatus Nitrotoga sp.]
MKNDQSRTPKCIALVLIILTLVAAPVNYAQAASDLAELDLSLEELMQVVVTSVTKKEQTLRKTAAAAFVIQAEDIRRSGATNIPEALRLAPGVQVSALGNNKWAVSIRGQADRFSNKLLVLVDGRSVYTPLFSGVMWEALDIPLENIARIEVIRGPGAAVWGANAVNGVINIITSSPFNNLGGKVALAAGSELRGYGLARYGWNLDQDTAVQIHAKAHDYGVSQPVSGREGADNWRNQSAGFKLESLKDAGNLQLQGGVYRSRAGDELTMISAPPANTLVRATQEISGSHLLARWDDKAGAVRQNSFQVSLDQSTYEHVILTEQRFNLDLQYKQRLSLGGRQDLIWGLDYRHSSDRIDNSPMFAVNERKRDTSQYSIFLQDEVALQPDLWTLSMGARLEHNNYIGIVLQPNLRLMWTPNMQNSIWLSMARAVRTPSRMERGGSAYLQADPVGAPPFVPPFVLQVLSNKLQEEKLDALDLGWRFQIDPSTSVDLAAFLYRYDQLRGAAATAPTLILPAGYLLIQTQENNANSALARGLEAALDWRPRPDWRLQANYSWLNMAVQTAALPGQTLSDYADTSPAHQFSLRSSLDLTSKVHWDAWIRHVSQIKRYTIPAYTTLDMRLAWQASKTLDVALVGQNLLDSAHPEFGSQFIVSSLNEVQRGFFVKADWKF